jgi:hypothetical protein
MHVIRLRAAWTHEGGGVSVRRFNKPTGLDGGERVWLVWEGAVEAAELNGEPLDISPTPSPIRHDVTDRLRLANEMRLVGSNRDVLATVQLEIG